MSYLRIASITFAASNLPSFTQGFDGSHRNKVSIHLKMLTAIFAEYRSARIRLSPEPHTEIAAQTGESDLQIAECNRSQQRPALQAPSNIVRHKRLCVGFQGATGSIDQYDVLRANSVKLVTDQMSLAMPKSVCNNSAAARHSFKMVPEPSNCTLSAFPAIRFSGYMPLMMPFQPLPAFPGA